MVKGPLQKAGATRAKADGEVNSPLQIPRVEYLPFEYPAIHLK
jgi:hypothetical protein